MEFSWMLLPLFIPVVVFMATVLATIAIWSVLSSRASLIEARLRPYNLVGGGAAIEEELALPFSQRVIIPILTSLGRLVNRVTPQAVVENIQHQLIMAGNPGSLGVGGFIAIKTPVIAILLFLSIQIYRLVWREAPIGLGILVILPLSVYLGWRLPDFWLEGRIASRHKRIQRALPDALDLIVICVEAGMALEASLSTVADRFPGPLSDEIRLTLHEISLGKRRRDALRDMGTRTGAPDLISFVAAVSKADQTGVNIGEVLRIQADGMRVRRRQRAQEEATAAPVKMIIPLILCIFPALFVVILGPSVIRVLDVLLGPR